MNAKEKTTLIEIIEKVFPETKILETVIRWPNKPKMGLKITLNKEVYSDDFENVKYNFEKRFKETRLLYFVKRSGPGLSIFFSLP